MGQHFDETERTKQVLKEKLSLLMKTVDGLEGFQNPTMNYSYFLTMLVGTITEATKDLVDETDREKKFQITRMGHQQ